MTQPTPEWEWIAVAVAVADGAFHKLTTDQRDRLEASMIRLCTRDLLERHRDGYLARMADSGRYWGGPNWPGRAVTHTPDEPDDRCRCGHPECGSC